ncbi:hypothetical protein, partial [Pseudomonas sp. FW301-21B01]|uniref:hypothetical protein n=1 Tax=Pseudomonas sp. FW301-21B01 TaxID=2070624 RepID=UPI001C442734
SGLPDLHQLPRWVSDYREIAHSRGKQRSIPHGTPDLSHRQIVDDRMDTLTDHHLFVSLGCATENLRQAAIAHGLNAKVTFDSAASTARVGLV